MRLSEAILVAVGPVLLVGGCGQSEKAEWKVVAGDTPWTAPGRQATEKRLTTPNWNAANITIAWEDAGGSSHRSHKLAASADAYLDAIGYNAKLREECDQRHIPPPWKTIVAITPTVALHVPSYRVPEKGPFLNRPHHDLGPTWFGPGYDYGTTVLYNDGMKWFSPDLKAEPKEITFSDRATAEIPLPDGKLTLVRQGPFCKIARE
jgi:hypothetical protein